VARYEINESVTEPKAVFGTDLSTVQAAVPKNGAPVVARNAGTTTSRALYAAASGGSPLTQPILTTNGRIDAYVEGEAPVDLLINYGLSNQYTQRWTPPQRGVPGDAVRLDENGTTYTQINALLASAAGNYPVLVPPDVTIPVDGIVIPSFTELYGFGRMSELQVAPTSGPYPLYVQPGATDIWFHDFAIDGNKANISGDPDATNDPQFALYVAGTIASPCRRIYVNNVYQHDSKRLGIGFANVQGGRLHATVENNERDGATLYYNCRDIDIGLTAIGCGDDHLGINSGEGSTIGLCEGIRGWVIARGPSTRQKGRAVTIRGGHNIQLDVLTTDVSQSAVVLNNFSTANLTDFDIRVQAYRPGQGGGVAAPDKDGVLVQVGEGGYIGGGRIAGRVSGALRDGVRFENLKASAGSDDIRDLDVDVAVSGSGDSDWNTSAAGLSDVRIKPKVMTATATWNPGSVADGASVTTTVAVPGAAIGDVALAPGFSSISGINWDVIARVSATNQVTVKVTNRSGSTQVLGSGTLRVEVRKYWL
jgi:hypothetical protein